MFYSEKVRNFIKETCPRLKAIFDFLGNTYEIRI